MSARNQLVWFRNDFRLHDHSAWAEATQRGQPVAAVYVFCDQQLAAAHDVGPARLDFNARNLACLRDALDAQGVPLFFLDAGTFARVPEQIVRLCRALAVGAIHWNEEYAWNERARDRAVTAALEDEGVSVHTYTDQLLIEPHRVRTQNDDPYKVFTPFRRRWQQALRRDDYAERKADKPIGLQADKPEVALDPATVDTQLQCYTVTGQAERFVAGEKEAARRLKKFAEEKMEDYRDARNFPARDATSALSPYLSAGVLSIRACLRAAMSANDGEIDTGSEGVVTWISELIWREFYRGVLVNFPWVNKHLPFKRDTAAVPWRQDEAEFRRWCEGCTGYPIVDAAQRQLNETGWMHNRLRMITAMFLTKHLLIDWRWGERYFMQKLVDGDFASNNGGWQWSASTGTDAQPYFRIFNPMTQSEKFDPGGEFIRAYVPELRDRKGKAIHQPQASGDLLDADYPAAIVEHKFARERALNAFKENT